MNTPLFPSVVMVILLLNLCMKDISIVHAFTSPITRSSYARTINLEKNHEALLSPTKESRATTSLKAAKSADEEAFDKYLEKNNLIGATRLIKSPSSLINLNDKQRIVDIFKAIERRTMEAEENSINKRIADGANLGNLEIAYPPESPARKEMTTMYQTLKDKDILIAFGAASNGNFPVQGSKIITPTLLEKITNLSMVSLTPQPTNTLLIAGGAFALLEVIFSAYSGVNLNFLILVTIFLAFLDKLLVNGAVFESITRLAMPEYSRKILKHEAGHFLCAYLLGCPVEGFVLNSWAALADARFGGKSTTVSAGTSFFDPDLSDEINGRKPVSRSSIDRYSIVVMGGIAAEALNFGRADGGAGDEAALISFLSNLNPKAGGAVSWDLQRIKNQARWGALQAVSLLKEYNASYNALVEALENGGDLGECVYAIENAAKENGLPTIAEKPLGYIVDQGPFGEFVTTIPDFQVENNAVRNIADTSSKKLDVEDEIVSLEDLKKRMQEKLTEIDSKLDRFQ